MTHNPNSTSDQSVLREINQVAEQLTLSSVDIDANRDLASRDMRVLGFIIENLLEERTVQERVLPQGLFARVFKRYERETYHQRIGRINNQLGYLGLISSITGELNDGELDHGTYVTRRDFFLETANLKSSFNRHCDRLRQGGVEANSTTK